MFEPWWHGEWDRSSKLRSLVKDNLQRDMLLLMLNCFGRIFLTEKRIVQKNYVITKSYLVAMIFFSRMDSSFVNSIAG